ncbi:hypothetical protein FHG87_013575 [Trinorchestia longiramus]|nr:hypothetical protein FHG87_013575 [Trinorchestia longiramus]
MLRVGSQFDTFDELSQRLEEFQKVERVQLWVRDSRTVTAAAKRARRKSLNPALKYAELTYSCVFGGRRPSDTTKIHNQTSAGGCPFKVRLSTSADGQALVVKEINNAHNHEPGKVFLRFDDVDSTALHLWIEMIESCQDVSQVFLRFDDVDSTVLHLWIEMIESCKDVSQKLHDEPRRLFKKTQQSRFSQDSVETPGSFGAASVATAPSSSAITNMSAMHKQPIKLIVSKSRLNSTVSPFANLQQLQHQQPQQHQQQNPQPLKLHVSLPQQAQRCFIKKQDPELIAEPSIITSDLVDGVESLYSFTEFGRRSYQFGSNNPVLNTPSNSSLSDTPESSKSSSPDISTTNTPNNSPINSPANSLSSAAEESVLNFHFPPSPISPNSAPLVSVKPREDEDHLLEPLYDLSEALEDGLASLPTFESDELPQLSNSSNKFANLFRKQENLHNEKVGGQASQLASAGCSGSKSNITGAVTHFPVVRTLSSSSNSIRVGFPANTSLCRPRTITTPNGSYYINSETGLVKTVKANGYGSGSDTSNGQSTSIQYNLVSSKVTAGLGSGARNAGKITIQHYMPSATPAAVTCSSTNPNAVSKCTTSNSDPYTRAVPVLVGIGSSARNLQPADQSVDCGTVSGSVTSVGPIKNYRARIAKKPYAAGSILKVVKSDNVSSPIASVDRLINTVTPDKVRIGLNRFNVQSETSECTTSSAGLGGVRKLFSDAYAPSSEIDRVIDAAADHFKSESLCSDKTNPVNKMDQVISGGLEADIKIKNELVHGAGKDDFCDFACDVSVKQEVMDTCDALDKNGLLFVVDGLEPSLGEDIPLSPEDYFNVADIEKFDFTTF